MINDSRCLRFIDIKWCDKKIVKWSLLLFLFVYFICVDHNHTSSFFMRRREDTCFMGIHGVVFLAYVTGEWKWIKKFIRVLIVFVFGVLMAVIDLLWDSDVDSIWRSGIKHTILVYVAVTLWITPLFKT